MTATAPHTTTTGQGKPETKGRSADKAVIVSAALTLAGSGLGALLTLVCESLAAKILGPYDYGLYAIGVMLAKVGETIAVFGLPLAILHFLPVHIDRSEKRLAFGTILGTASIPFLLGGGLSFVLWTQAAWIATHVLNQPAAAPYIAVTGAAIPGLAMADMLGNVARAFGQPLVYVVVRNVIPPVCYLAALVYLQNAGSLGGHVPQAYLAATTTGAATGIVLVCRIVWHRIGLVRPDMQLRRLYTYAAPILANSVFSLVIVWTDLFLLGILTDPFTVGSYRACMLIVVAFDLIWNACSAATAPLYPVLIASDLRVRLQQVYKAAIRVTATIAMMLLAGITSNAQDILGMLHPEFRAAALALIVVAAGHAIKTSFGAASVLMVVGGGQRLEAGNSAITATLNLLLNLALIPLLGMLGAAIATATSLATISLLRCWQVRRMFRLVSIEAVTIRSAAAIGATAIGVAVLAASAGAGPGSGAVAFVGRLGALGAALLPTLWWGCLSRQERAMLIGLLRRGPSQPGTAHP